METEKESRENPDGSFAPRRLAVLEALLFSTGEATPEDELARAVGVEKEELHRLMSELASRCEAEDRGVRVLRLGESYQLCTKKELYDDLIRLLSAPKKPALTDAVLETLSIIAYKQPVTKAEIERIRGVNSDHAVNRLVEFCLVREVGRLNAPGRPILFGTTEEFLRRFGMESPAQLPQLDTDRKADFRAEAEKETIALGT